jgi:hypothetical protein
MSFTFTAHRGSANNKTAGTTISVSPDATLSSDALVVLRFVSDNQSGSAGSDASVSCSDDMGNVWNVPESWTKTAGGAADGVTGSIIWSVLDTAIATTDEITVTFSNVPAKAVGIDEWSVGTTDIQVEGTAGKAGATTDAVALDLAGLTSREYLIYTNVGYEYAAGNWETEDTDYTSLTEFGTAGGGPTGNVQSWGAYRIVTATSDQYDGQSKVALDWATVMVAFYEAGAAPVSVNVTTGSIVHTGIAATVTPGAVSITVTTGSITYNGIAATVTPVTSIPVTTGSITYTGIAASVTPGAVSVTATTGTITYTGIACTVSAGGAAQSVTVTTGAITFTGVAATVTPVTSITVTTGAIVFTGIAATITPGAVSITVTTGAIVFTGQAATVTPGAVSVTATTGAIVWTGQAASVTAGGPVSVTVTTGSIVWTGISASVVLILAAVVTVSDAAVNTITVSDADVNTIGVSDADVNTITVSDGS